MVVMLGALAPLGAANNSSAVSVDIADYQAKVESGLARVPQSDWNQVDSQDMADLNSQYVIDEKGKDYKALEEVFQSTCPSLHPHVLHPRSGQVVTDMATRYQNEVYFGDQFIPELRKRGFLRAIVEHECSHDPSDSHRLKVVIALKFSKEVATLVNYTREGDVDAAAALKLLSAGEDPTEMQKPLDFYFGKGTMTKTEYDIRSAKIQAAITTAKAREGMLVAAK